ncbi:MAG: LysE family translocator [Hoeflea sp.]|uniref:LysE family translocator n=1 Tax=Hoeflea sp. TaxID=1940281 RepID=UPI0032EB740C
MPLDTVLALAGFAFVMSVSPGPGNFLLLASGANFGFVRSIPLILGICLGFLSMVVLVGLGLGQVFKAYPLIGIAIRTACGVYIVWLAAKLVRSRSLGAEDGPRLGQPFTFLEAALLQLLNPKAWTVALIVTATYVDPGAPVKSLLALVVLFAGVNIPSISIWAASGTALRRFLAQDNRAAVFNIAMAILLLASMAPVLLSTLG